MGIHETGSRKAFVFDSVSSLYKTKVSGVKKRNPDWHRLSQQINKSKFK